MMHLKSIISAMLILAISLALISCEPPKPPNTSSCCINVPTDTDKKSVGTGNNQNMAGHKIITGSGGPPNAINAGGGITYYTKAQAENCQGQSVSTSPPTRNEGICSQSFFVGVTVPCEKPPRSGCTDNTTAPFQFTMKVFKNGMLLQSGVSTGYSKLTCNNSPATIINSNTIGWNASEFSCWDINHAGTIGKTRECAVFALLTVSHPVPTSSSDIFHLVMQINMHNNNSNTTSHNNTISTSPFMKSAVPSLYDSNGNPVSNIDNHLLYYMGLSYEEWSIAPSEQHIAIIQLDKCSIDEKEGIKK